MHELRPASLASLIFAPPRSRGFGINHLVLQPLVRGQGQELDKALRERDVLEQLARLLRSALGVEELVAHLLADLLELLALDPADQLRRDRLALGQLRA